MEEKELIVVYCPGEYHQNYLNSDGMAKKRILGFVSSDTRGTVYMQCGNQACRKSHGEDYNGMYKINLNGSRAVIATLVPKSKFPIIELPYLTNSKKQ